jgi:ABC-2 type transport system permease protein
MTTMTETTERAAASAAPRVGFNRYGVWAIFRFEMARFMRTLLQSVVTPVITTSLYFVVFGSAIGSRMSEVDGVPYGAFIVPVQILHPGWMIAFLLLTATTFSLFGFVIGIWAKGFEQLQFIPMLIVTPLTFLGGAFYSIEMLPPAWRTVALFNPVVYLISGFRWSFYGQADVSVSISLGMTVGFLVVLLLVVRWMVKTGYRLKN